MSKYRALWRSGPQAGHESCTLQGDMRPHAPASLADTLGSVTCPTLIIHPTGDTEIRLRQARADRDASGASDLTYQEMAGASHYLHGRRPEAMDLVVAWLADRFG